MPPTRRVKITAPDGDLLHLDILRAAEPDRPLVLLLHGLEGSARSHYMVGVLRRLRRLGWGAVALNFRGCGGVMNSAPRLYHSGDTGDARHVVQWMRRTFPNAPLYAIGFSLGANVLGRLLGEDAAQSPLRGAVMLSPPFDLGEAGPCIDRALGGFYARRFLGTLKRKILLKERQFPGIVNRADIQRVRTIVEFDDVGTAPLHGFEGVADYYRSCGCGGLLASIARHTLVIVSKDDPLLPSHAIPLQALKGNPMIHAVVTRKGGHLGFVAGTPWKPIYWAEDLAIQFLRDRQRFSKR